MALTQEQRENILNNSSFSKLLKKPEIKDAGLTMSERRANSKQEEKPGFFDRVGETFGDIKDVFTGSQEALENRSKDAISSIQETFRGDTDLATGSLQTVSQVGGLFSDIAGELYKGVGKIFVSQEVEDSAKEKLVNVMEETGALKALQGGQEFWKEYEKEFPTIAKNLESIGRIAEPAIDILGGAGASKVIKETTEQAFKGAKNLTKEGVEMAGKAGEAVASGVKKITPSPETIEAVKGIVSETGERIPRVASRVKEAGEKAVERSRRIAESEPVVANAIKSNLDDRIINTVSEADDATRKAYKQVLEIADETPTKIGAKAQPSKVSGDLAVKQYDLINNKKKAVGKSIGEEVDKLSKTTKIDMTDGISKADNILERQGLKINKKGIDFTGSNFTPAERTKIQELYKLATEGGDSLSPSQIRAKDNLFSKLQREANMEGVGSIIVETGDGNKSLFRVFRDIFSDKLDTVSPEIKKLNKEYRDLIMITDDIESSILKTPNFNVTKTADPTEFAKVNLRRIFGEAQSSPAFEAVADQMDMLARQLGYAEATPKQIAEFAIELRKLYPESIPKAGFQGGIAGGIKAGAVDAVGKIVKAGTPDLVDKRKALKELLDFYLGNK